MSQNLPWLEEAKKFIGQKEIKGPKHNPNIISWWSKIGASWFVDDETPWCAGYTGAMLENVGIRSSRSAMARSYSRWGQALTGPAIGAIVVFERGQISGHVGFIVGRDQNNNLMVLGGNQGDAVNIKPFPVSRVVAYRWPSGFALPTVTGMANLPRVNSNGILSTNEA